jgi:hypothetical protein
LSDRSQQVSEAIWELEARFGLDLGVADQDSIARVLGAVPAGALTAAAVTTAFRNAGVRPPSQRYAKALIARVDSLAPRPSLLDVLLGYRKFAIHALSGQFGGKTGGREEELRNSLLTYLPTRGYTEARTARGRTDILIPTPKQVIEVKVWNTKLMYEDGLVELERYIETEDPEAAYMVVFGNRVPLASIINDHTQAIAEERQIGNLSVPVVVIAFEVDQPSKAAANERRRARG